ncbi:kinase-like protein [Punctularia strigosozonata HHB-11173 SS5]|uniref:kinase-like protein n=1 Tax=Punctularia strigosozonata (strain HHB-11173) TaxID=741275 RepID=UPI00044170A6|nr:kinase-like protein [Punctularia strigosozonata HHB-11173 SS5]EIN12007.1 kinase-like protein [Punctularia strigosozonata HHB-11173 SS5]
MDGDESLSPSTGFPLLGRAYSDRFPVDHELNSYFVETYELEDELGAGGYGFVMTARHRTGGHETAVKFIIKDKVPAHAWVEDESFGRIPSEVMLVSLLEHDNIVRCLDIFEDSHYFYLVQELHGTPWVSRKKAQHQELAVPSLTPSSSCSTLDSLPLLTPHPTDTAIWESQLEQFRNGQKQPENLQPLPPPAFGRRASHDLFECIEQSRHKRLPEPQARYIFAQVIEAVHYLEQLGITHRDIKDENLVIDSDLKVKLIDFGSAVVSDPEQERPYYQMFYGTTAYAASEILQRKKYQAPPAEIWTLGVLLSFLLTGSSPFLSEDDAIHGRVSIRESIATTLSEDCLSLMQRCLEPDPSKRADIYEVRAHPWLQGTLDIECL